MNDLLLCIVNCENYHSLILNHFLNFLLKYLTLFAFDFFVSVVAVLVEQVHVVLIDWVVVGGQEGG